MNKQQVIELWQQLCDVFCSHVQRKQEAVEMRILGSALETADVMSAQTFMTQFATTLGSNIYLPFVVGTTPPSYLVQAMMAVHEVTHVVQCRKYGMVQWMNDYVRSPGFRATVEAEAWIYQQILHRFLRGGTRPLVAGVASFLAPYRVGAAAIKAAQRKAATADRMLAAPDWQAHINSSRVGVVQPLRHAVRILRALGVL